MQDIDIIDSMSEEISSVLKKNLYVLLNPIMEEQNKTNEALLNFPITQKLTNKIKQLETKLLESNCQKNIKIFELRQEIKKRDEKIKGLEKQLNTICSIKLEVKELDTVKEEVDLDSISIVSNGTNKKIDNKPIKLSTNIWNTLGSDDEEDEGYNYSEDDDEEEVEDASKLNSSHEEGEAEDDEDDEEEEVEAEDEEDDEEEVEAEDAAKLNSSHEEVEAEDEEDDEEEEVEAEDDNKNSSFISTVLRAQQNADNYETIDTASDQEEEVVEKAIENKENLNSSDEEELELEEIVINEIKYLTDSRVNGTIYKCDEDGEIIEDDEGDLIIVGKFDNKRSELYF